VTKEAVDRVVLSAHLAQVLQQSGKIPQPGMAKLWRAILSGGCAMPVVA